MKSACSFENLSVTHLGKTLDLAKGKKTENTTTKKTPTKQTNFFCSN